VQKKERRRGSRNLVFGKRGGESRSQNKPAISQNGQKCKRRFVGEKKTTKGRQVRPGDRKPTPYGVAEKEGKDLQAMEGKDRKKKGGKNTQKALKPDMEGKTAKWFSPGGQTATRGDGENGK